MSSGIQNPEPRADGVGGPSSPAEHDHDIVLQPSWRLPMKGRPPASFKLSPGKLLFTETKQDRDGREQQERWVRPSEALPVGPSNGVVPASPPPCRLAGSPSIHQQLSHGTQQQQQQRQRRQQQQNVQHLEQRQRPNQKHPLAITVPRQQHWHAPPPGRTSFVPIKSWRCCREVAVEIAKLPDSRLDQKLLSAALQHMTKVHGVSPRPYDGDACADLLQLCGSRLHEFDAQGLAILVRTAAKLGHRLTTAWLVSWADAALDRLQEFKPQDLANSIYAIGRMGQRLPAAALRHFSAATISACPSMLPLELAPTLLGLAHMGASPHEATAAAEALLQEGARRVSAFSPQELSNLLWAYSKVTDLPSWQRCGGLLGRLLDEVERRGARGLFLAQETNALLLAQANTAYYHPGALEVLFRHVTDDLIKLEGQHLGNTLLALGLLPHPGTAPLPTLSPPQLVDPCRELSEQGPGIEGGPGTARHITWAQIVALREEVERRLWRRPAKPSQALSSQAVCHALWGLAALEACTESFWQSAMCSLKETHWQEGGAGYGQLHHAALLLESQGCQWAVLPRPIAELAQEAIEAVHEQWVSPLQGEVSALLDSIGYQHEAEYVPVEGLSPVDLAMPGAKLAIEVDGPRHFTSNQVQGHHYYPLGRTLLRNRLLTAHGWRILAVPYYVWRDLHGRQEKQEWLAGQLKCLL